MFLRGLENPHDKDLHVSLQQQPSLGWQYLGLPLALLMGLMNKNILVMDPGLIKPATGLNPTECWGRQRGSVSWKGILGKEGHEEAGIGNHSAAGSWDSPETRIRVGIVMERRGTLVNTMPCSDRFQNPNNNVAALGGVLSIQALELVSRYFFLVESLLPSHALDVATVAVIR